MRHECEYQACRCQVSEGNTFCSDLCGAGGKATTGAAEALDMAVCRCGHPACAVPEEGKQVR